MDHNTTVLAPAGRASSSPGGTARRRRRTRGGVRRHLYRWSVIRASSGNNSHLDSINFDINVLPAVVRDALEFEDAGGHGDQVEDQVRTPPVTQTGVAETVVSGKTPFAGSPAVQSAASSDDASFGVSQFFNARPLYILLLRIDWIRSSKPTSHTTAIHFEHNFAKGHLTQPNYLTSAIIRRL